MRHGAQDLVDEIVDGVDVAPGFERRIPGRLDHIEMNAVGEEVAPAKEHDHLCRPPAGEEKSVAQAVALRRAHRSVVKIESEIANIVLLIITDLAECAVTGFCAYRERRMRQPRGAHAQGHGCRQLYAAPLTINFWLEMADPDRAVDRCDAHRAVALG